MGMDARASAAQLHQQIWDRPGSGPASERSATRALWRRCRLGATGSAAQSLDKAERIGVATSERSTADLDLPNSTYLRDLDQAGVGAGFVRLVAAPSIAGSQNSTLVPAPGWLLIRIAPPD